MPKGMNKRFEATFRKKNIVPINTDDCGDAKTILSGYFKYGAATLIGGQYGTTGTAIIEIYEKDGHTETPAE